MTPTVSARRALADRLQELHDQYSSWRKVHDLHYPDVSPGTLCTIAKNRGAYIPKKHWKALGLVEVRREALPGERRVQRRIGKMARETSDAVLRRKQ